jgi:hypothetical protein
MGRTGARARVCRRCSRCTATEDMADYEIEQDDDNSSIYIALQYEISVSGFLSQLFCYLIGQKLTYYMSKRIISSKNYSYYVKSTTTAR